MVLAAQSQLEQEMQEQQAQGGLLHGEQMAEFSRLEAQANAKTSRTKTALDTLATTQQASSCSVVCAQCQRQYVAGVPRVPVHKALQLAVVGICQGKCRGHSRQ